TGEELMKLGVAHGNDTAPFYRGTGCNNCNQTGYRGRTGIYEFLLVDDEIRRLVVSKADSNIIQQAAMKKGMTTLKQEGASKVRQGLTATEEVLRITQHEIDL
ncbi:MAG: type II secretion system protein GspE, partial [Nitrospirota bacterium]